MIIGVIILVILLYLSFGISFDSGEIIGDVHVKTGMLTSVSTDNSFVTVVFNDGMSITCKENNDADALEMADYLESWIGENMVFEYTLYPGDSHYTITGVNYE